MNTPLTLRRMAPGIAAAGACLWLLPVPAAGVVSSNGGPNPPYTGLNINNFLGADTFYRNGYTGSRAIAANIQAGHVWNGHETLAHVTVFLDDPASPPPNGDFDRSATGTGFMLGGRLGGPNPGEWQRGIAYGADLWSGAVATSWTATGFNLTQRSVAYPYHTMMVTGVEGRTADVMHSAWGNNSIRNNSARAGRVIDALANQTGKTVVLSAGQSGETATPQVWGVGANFNSITVGELQSDTSSPPYDSRTARSSFGPNAFWNPATGAFVQGAVATVDLAAPGSDLTIAHYGGTTGGNTGRTFEPGNNLYRSNQFGRSGAQVAGGATLIVDAGKARFGGGASIDGRVVKSVLQNSAHKIAGWDNGQITDNGVVTTTQSLDYFVGAGRMDLAKAYTQYTAGTTDVPGLGGGRVRPVGWDFGQVRENAATDYVVPTPLLGGTTLTGTLNWFLDNSYDYGTDTLVDQSLDNLDLEVWKTTPAGAAQTLVAQSSSTYNNVEHLSLAVPESGQYLLRVKWNGEIFDRVGDANEELFGLAWSGTAVLPGDANADGSVNGTDFALLAGNFGRTGRFWGEGDFNDDGSVNGTDFALLAGNFGRSLVGPSAAMLPAEEAALGAFAQAHGISFVTPEPGGAGAFAVAGLLLAGRRRRAWPESS